MIFISYVQIVKNYPEHSDDIIWISEDEDVNIYDISDDEEDVHAAIIEISDDEDVIIYDISSDDEEHVRDNNQDEQVEISGDEDVIIYDISSDDEENVHDNNQD
jgi:hypothetical protein